MSATQPMLVAAVVLAAGCGQGAGSNVVAQFHNPVIAGDFPDPSILKVGNAYYAYATTDGSDNLQAARSPDLVRWTRLADPLPKLPIWQPSTRGYTWAPEVASIDNLYVMYYTGRLAEIGRQCISVAVASDPGGPFVDRSTAPLVCQRDAGGSIDPSRFVDGNTQYLIWKNDGNCCGLATQIWCQQLSSDGLSVLGKPVNLGIRNDRTWEGNVIEAPVIVKHDQTYYLFYSANNYAGPDYAVGYATARALLGPYTKARENPILATRLPAAGPGGQAVIDGPHGGLWMAYHAWDSRQIGYELGGKRAMWIDRLTFEDGRPVVHGPTVAAQPLP